jgi:hypothetical protein
VRLFLGAVATLFVAGLAFGFAGARSLRTSGGTALIPPFLDRARRAVVPPATGAEDRGGITEEPWPVTGRFERWRPESPVEVAAAFGVASAYVAVVAYLYVVGFYDGWGLSPAQAGLSPVQLLARSVAFVLVLSVVVAALGFWLPGLSARFEALRDSPWTELLAGVVVAGFGLLVLVVVSSSPFFDAVLAIAAVVIVLVMVKRAVDTYDRRPGTGVGIEPAVRPASDVDRYLVVASVLVALLVPVYALAAGSSDSRDLRSGASTSGHASSMQSLAGTRTEPVDVAWLGEGANPLEASAATLLQVGQSNQTVYLYDYAACSLLAVPVSEVAVRTTLGRPAGIDDLPAGLPLPRCDPEDEE